MRGKYGLKIMILTPTIFSTELSFKDERKLTNSVYKNSVIMHMSLKPVHGLFLKITRRKIIIIMSG
jgi:hypothetical protein